MTRFFLWLATAIVLFSLGIAVGAGPLQSDEKVGAELTSTQAKLEQLSHEKRTAEAEQEFTNSFVHAYGVDFLAGRLTTSRIALIIIGDPAEAQEDLLGEFIEHAGGSVVTTVRVPLPVMAGQLQPVVSELVKQLPIRYPLAEPRTDNAYGQLGELSGAGLVAVAKASRRHIQAATATLSALEAAGLSTTSPGSADAAASADRAIILLDPAIAADQQQRVRASQFAVGWARHMPTTLASSHVWAEPDMRAFVAEYGGKDVARGFKKDPASVPLRLASANTTALGLLEAVLATAQLP